MSPVFKKLNLKDQKEIVVVGAPASFEPEIASLEGVAVKRSVGGELAFSLAFVTKQKEVDALAKSVGKSAAGDAVVWFAYPKQSSKKYTCEFNRDNGWAELGKAGFEPVRMVAIDEDWSAARFRRVDFIKSLTRPAEYALSAGGKAKTAAAAKAAARTRAGAKPAPKKGR
ncbi:MAG TPA: hypothetical protein VE907_14445 [Gammaproteobacteria bacterium]|nr:hypothetical protein [Gammaproteobacteria bacterium]